jgi:hypothetical protein
MRPLQTIMPLLLAALLLAACGGPSDDTAAGPPKPDADAALRATVRADALSRAAHTTPFQARLLRDGRVTFAEYARTTHALAGCLRAFGGPVKVGPIRRGPAGELGFRWSLRHLGPGRVTAERRARQAFQRCYLTYQNDAASVYANGRVVAPSKRGRVLSMLTDCLRRSGVRVAESASIPSIVRALEAAGPRALRCADRHADIFRVLDLPR